MVRVRVGGVYRNEEGKRILIVSSKTNWMGNKTYYRDIEGNVYSKFGSCKIHLNLIEEISVPPTFE